MKKFSLIQLVLATLLATQAWAGTLTVNGNLAVLTNLSAQSITLGNVTETNWNFLPLQGDKYVVVAEGTNDAHRGNNLRAAYTTATTLGPTATNRVAVIVPPGSYSFGTTNLVMNSSYVDLIGLVPAQMTSKQVFTDSGGTKRPKTVANVQCPVCIYAAISTGTIVQSNDNIRIESVILSNTSSGVAYYPTVAGTNTILRHVAMNSMRTAVKFAGQYVDCVGGDTSFGSDGDATGAFIDCVAGHDSFGGGQNGGGNASGTFIGCVGGDSSFGIDGGASGTFINCVGGGNSFGGVANADAISTGTFVDCVGGDSSFGTVITSGTYVNCVAGSGSFAGLSGSAKLQHCKGGAGSFGGFGASEDFNYNVGGTNTFLMLPNLRTSTNGLPSGSVWNSNGVLRVRP